MLKNARNYKNELKLESIWARDLPRNKAFVFGLNGFIDLYGTPNYCEMVSVGEDNSIIGFLRYEISNNTANNLEIINFRDSESEIKIFATDLKRFWKNIFEINKLDSVRFSVKENTESAKKWQKVVKLYQGEIIVRGEWLFCEIKRDKCLEYGYKPFNAV